MPNLAKQFIVMRPSCIGMLMMLMVLRMRSVRFAIPPFMHIDHREAARPPLLSPWLHQECARKTSTVGVRTRVFRLLLPSFLSLSTPSLSLFLSPSLNLRVIQRRTGALTGTMT